jgi:hypothetical protein
MVATGTRTNCTASTRSGSASAGPYVFVVLVRRRSTAPWSGTRRTRSGSASAGPDPFWSFGRAPLGEPLNPPVASAGRGPIPPNRSCADDLGVAVTILDVCLQDRDNAAQAVGLVRLDLPVEHAWSACAHVNDPGVREGRQVAMGFAKADRLPWGSRRPTGCQGVREGRQVAMGFAKADRLPWGSRRPTGCHGLSSPHVSCAHELSG